MRVMSPLVWGSNPHNPPLGAQYIYFDILKIPILKKRYVFKALEN
jgi:hypothetical protein